MEYVSVVITTFNGEKFITKQLESIRLQSRTPDEVLIFDDASTDRTVSIVDAYINDSGLTNWKLKVNERNVGYKKNFYYAIKEAQGDFIFLCDQDDEWKENKIERSLEIMERYPEIEALNCGVELIDGQSKELEQKTEKNYQNCGFLYSKTAIPYLSFYSTAYLAKHNISPGCTMVINKCLQEEFVEKYNFLLPHDWFLNLIASTRNGCAFLNEPLLCYRKHDFNVIGANTGALAGIKKKTREVRIEDYLNRKKTLEMICNTDSTVEIKTEQLEVLKLYEKMICFYEGPSPAKLVQLYLTPGYRELAKRKVRLWEVLVAFRIDGLIFNLITRKENSI